MSNETTNPVLSTLNISLNNVQQVADVIKGAMNNSSLNDVGDLSATISPDKLLGMVREQTELVSNVLSTMGSSAIAGQSTMKNTLNTALSTVMGSMACTINNMSDSLSKIKELSQQIETIKNTLQTGNITSLKGVTK